LLNISKSRGDFAPLPTPMLTATYDTVWHRGLTCKLLRLLPDKYMARMIMELVGNRSFILTTGNGKRSMLRHL